MRIEQLSGDFERKAGDLNEGEPSFWSFDWFCEQSANARAILNDLGTCSFDIDFVHS